MRSSSHFKAISQILIFLVVGFLISLWCSGCASFAQWNLQKLETLPTPPETLSKAKLTFALSIIDNNNNSISDSSLDRWIEMRYALNGFEETGYFSDIGPTVANPDLQINVHFQYKVGESSDSLAILCGATLFLICLDKQTDHYIVDAEVTHLKTGQVKTYHLKDSINTRANIFLIFIPWQWGIFVEGDIVENIFKHLAVKIHEDGLLVTAKNGTK